MFNSTRLLKIDSYSCVTVTPTVAQENNAEINTANIFTERVLFKSFFKSARLAAFIKFHYVYLFC